MTADEDDAGVILLREAASYLQSRIAPKPGRIVLVRWNGSREFTVESFPPKKRWRGPEYGPKVIRVSSPNWEKQPRYRGMLLMGEVVADGVGIFAYDINGRVPEKYFWLMEKDLNSGDSARNFAQRIEKCLTSWP